LSSRGGWEKDATCVNALLIYATGLFCSGGYYHEPRPNCYGSNVADPVLLDGGSHQQFTYDCPSLRFGGLRLGIMQMSQVHYFLALCEERNFTRAAKRCGVSQPSLTNAIKRLERKLGGSLFHRDRRNTQLTELGRVVKPYFKQLDQCAYQAKRNVGELLAARSVKSSQPKAKEAFMRAHHVIAVVAVLVVGFGAKQFFFPPMKAEANIHAAPSASVDVFQMQIDHPNRNNLPVQKIHDMTFVYSDSD
jgi:hypothetical protein